MNAASSHVTGSSIYNLGAISPNETFCNIILTAPVGSGNLTVGYFSQPGSNRQMPPGMNATVTVPIHLKVTDPAERTLLEQDVVTPCILPIEFETRGEYRVYLTNNGNEKVSIPIGTEFEMGNSQNREADKYLLASVLTAAGAFFLAASVTTNFLLKRLRKGTNSKSNEDKNTEG